MKRGLASLRKSKRFRLRKARTKAFVRRHPNLKKWYRGY